MQQLIDPYRILGVLRGATDVEIKAAHRKLVKRYHPDTSSKTDTERFLQVQEAYKVLSDPLLRREWDLKHAPGPLRADRSAPPAPRRRKPAAPRTNSAHRTTTGSDEQAAGASGEASEPDEQTSGPGAQSSGPGAQSSGPGAQPADSPPGADPDPRRRPRSTHAYTWSAAEVPWWEDGGAHTTDKREPNRRRPHQPERDAPTDGTERTFSAQQDFDLYNRSSGAAWSMAARAYFRRGDADLPRRGSFQYEGTQVVTAGRARSAAEAAARRHAAAAAAAAAAATTAAARARERASVTDAAPARAAATPSARASVRPSPIGDSAAAAPTAGTYRSRVSRLARTPAWPSLFQRLGLAAVAWLPPAALISVVAAGSGSELIGTVALAASLVALVVLPRLAYVAAVATVLVLIVGGLFMVALMTANGGLPSAARLTSFAGGMLLVGYLGSAVAIFLGPASLRPWSSR